MAKKLTPHHAELLNLIKASSGTPTQHTFLDSYLGNTNPRYAINAPAMRRIAKEWLNDHSDLSAKSFAALVTNLVQGKSSTEKLMAGVLLDYSRKHQRTFPPQLFEQWLDHLQGWAEVDSLCTGKYTATEVPGQWKAWKKILAGFSKSENISKRRASLVLLCSPLRSGRYEYLAKAAFENVTRLQHEKAILITKAISWVLRSAVKHHALLVKKYIALNKESLPKIAVRETLTVLKTGKKTKSITKTKLK